MENEIFEILEQVLNQYRNEENVYLDRLKQTDKVSAWRLYDLLFNKANKPYRGLLVVLSQDGISFTPTQKNKIDNFIYEGKSTYNASLKNVLRDLIENDKKEVAMQQLKAKIKKDFNTAVDKKTNTTDKKPDNNTMTMSYGVKGPSDSETISKEGGSEKESDKRVSDTNAAPDNTNASIIYCPECGGAK